MRRWIVLLVISIFILTACATGEAQRQRLPYKSVESLPLVIKGTYGYTTLESPAGTIDEYTGMHDSTMLPDCQVGFRLHIPLSIENAGEDDWYDPIATVTFTIIGPQGKEESITRMFKESKVMKRMYVAGEKIDTLEDATEADMTLRPGDKRVFYFTTDYIPKTNGRYNVMVKIESLNKIRGVLAATSALTFNAGTPDSEYIKLPTTCSPYIQCGGIQVCCTKGVDVPTENITGHCANQCIAGEKEVPYIVKLS
jgi:hypothetical protein